MPSAVLDARRAAVPSDIRDLLVLWQHPESGEFLPVGRFSRAGDQYEFAYTRTAALIADFRPLLGLRDLHHRYVGDQIPAVFEQRIMDADRPDYADYMASIGLPPAATPWEQIVHSGGMRSGDTLQFMPMPSVVQGRARALILVNGMRHVMTRSTRPGGRLMEVTPRQHESALCRLSVGESVRAEHEPENPKDDNALLITVDGVPLGYVPRILSGSVRSLLPTEFVVRRVGPPGTPPHLRLVVELDRAAPEGFEFDPGQRWLPLVP